MDKVAQVRINSAYGKMQIYPMNDIATHICKTLGQTTLTQQNVDDFKAMGFEFAQVALTKTGLVELEAL